MKIIIKIFVLTCIIFFVSCSENSKPVSKRDNKTAQINQTQTRSIINKDGKVLINLAFQGNEKYELIVGTDEKLTQEMGDQKQSVSQSNTITYDMDIQKKNEGLFTGDIKFNRIQKSIDAGKAGKQSFDSQQKGEMKDLPPNVKILLDIIGKSYQIDFTSLGRVKDTRGADKMIKEIMANIKEKDDIKKMIAEAINQEFGPQKLADFFEKLTNFTDSIPRSQGEKWNKIYSIESGINLSVNTTYEVAEVNNQYIKINLKSQLIDKNKNRTQTVDNVISTVNVNGEQGGYILIDATTGFINKSEVNQKIHVTETRSKKDDPKQSISMKTTKDAHFTIIVNKRQK